jgi:hypothetical protein
MEGLNFQTRNSQIPIQLCQQKEGKRSLPSATPDFFLRRLERLKLESRGILEP